MTNTYDMGGVRMGNETNTFVPAQSRVRPIRDQIVVEPLQWKPSKIIAVEWHGKPLRGIVRAAGPGRYLIQYASGPPHALEWHPVHHPPPKGKRTASRESKIFRPCDVKVGDIVEFGGLEIRGYLWTTFVWGAVECVLCREEDVAIVVEEEAA